MVSGMKIGRKWGFSKKQEGIVLQLAEKQCPRYDFY